MTNSRLHLLNSVLKSSGVYSCAIDSFIELVYYILYPKLKELPELTHSIFLRIIFECCNVYENLTRNHNQVSLNFNFDLLQIQVRDPIWDFVIDKCPSFRLRDCNAVFSEIFQEHVFEFNEIEKAMFLTCYDYDFLCNTCGNNNIKSTATFVQYVSNLHNEQNLNFLSESWPTVLFSQNFSIVESKCDFCNEKQMIQSYFVVPAKFLFVEFEPTICNQLKVHETIVLNGIVYKLKGVIRNSGAHFSIAIESENAWIYIDDLKRSVNIYPTFQNLNEVLM